MDSKSSNMMSCPYNKSHQITQKNYQKHIQKCNSAKEKQQNFYFYNQNEDQILNKQEIEYHKKYFFPERPLLNQYDFENKFFQSAYDEWKKTQITQDLQSVMNKGDASDSLLQKNSNKVKIQKRKRENNFHSQKDNNNNGVNQKNYSNQNQKQYSENILMKNQNNSQEEDKNNQQQDLSVSQSLLIYDNQNNRYFDVENSYDACYQIKKSNTFKNSIFEFKNMILKKMDDLKQQQDAQSPSIQNKLIQKKVNNQHTYERKSNEQVRNDQSSNQNKNELSDELNQLEESFIQRQQGKYNRKHIQIHNIPEYEREQFLLLEEKREYNNIYSNSNQNMRGNRQIKMREIKQEDQIQDKRNNQRCKKNNKNKIINEYSHQSVQQY